MALRIPLFLLLLTSTAFAGDPAKQHAWIDETSTWLKAFTPSDSSPGVREKERRRETGTMYRYQAKNEGMIRFRDGSWIYLKLHSGHDDKEIGDQVLAIDDKGKLHWNAAHVCGGITIMTDTDGGFASVEEFLAHHVENKPWVEPGSAEALEQLRIRDNLDKQRALMMQRFRQRRSQSPPGSDPGIKVLPPSKPAKQD